MIKWNGKDLEKLSKDELIKVVHIQEEYIKQLKSHNQDHINYVEKIQEVRN